MSEHIIEVNHITKRFKIYFDKGYNLKERVLFRQRNRYEWRNVIEDVSFFVDKGEALGLIGHNGCGKSTTLKLLTRIMYPNSGTIKVKGRVSSLIELGAGFHPDMSGKENIYINAAIFGLSRKEIDQRIDKIIEFSELGRYIDNPIRTYSSGMYMRLAFSIAINVDADVLLVDEILAVGDANFQRKCLKHMYELKAQGVTIVIVTHDTDMVAKFCDRAIWLNDGQIACVDKASIVAQKYVDYMADLHYEQANGNMITLDRKVSEQVNKEVTQMEAVPKDDYQQQVNRISNDENDSVSASSEISELAGTEILTDDHHRELRLPATASVDASHHGNLNLEIVDAGWINDKNERTNILRAGKAARIIIKYKVNKDPGKNLICGICINTLDKQCIYGVNTSLDEFEPSTSGNIRCVACVFDSIDLFAGKYELQVALHGNDDDFYDFYTKYCEFEIVSEQRYKGIMSIKHHWINEDI